MKKKVLSVLLATAVLLSLLLLPGCGSSGSAGELNLFIWTEYIPQSVIDAFQKDTGIKVNVTMFSSNEEMLSKVKSSNEGTYDIVQPSDYMVESMIAQDLLQKLDISKITNIGNIDKAYMDQSFDPGNAYSVPYRGGICALAVNTGMVDEEITSYTQLFDSKFANSIVALDDFRIVIGIVALSMGYSPNETDPAKLAEIEARLLELKPNIKILDSDSPKSAMINEETSIGLMWNAEVSLAMAGNENVKIVFPEEGNTLFLDNFCITKGAKNVEAAEKFINYILDPEVSAEISRQYPYLNPNAPAVELLGEDYKNDLAANVPSDVFAKGQYIANIDTTVEIYNDMWAKFTS